MHIYSIYTNNKDDELTIVKQDFSLVAGLFNLLWTLYYKMWFISSLLLFIIIPAGVFLPFTYYLYINTVIIFIFTFFSSGIRECFVAKMGGRLSDIILARTEEEAEVKYLERC